MLRYASACLWEMAPVPIIPTLNGLLLKVIRAILAAVRSAFSWASGLACETPFGPAALVFGRTARQQDSLCVLHPAIVLFYLLFREFFGVGAQPRKPSRIREAER